MKVRLNPNRPEGECYLAFDFIRALGRAVPGGLSAPAVRLVIRGGERASGDGPHLAIVTMTADEADETAELLRQFADLARNAGRAAR